MSPLWGIPGFNLSTIAFDVMHCIDLGVTQYDFGLCCFLMLTCNFLGLQGEGNQEHLALRNLRCLKLRLWKWYNSTSYRTSRVAKLSKKMAYGAPSA